MQESFIAEKEFTAKKNKISPDEKEIHKKPDYLGAFVCIGIFAMLVNLTSLAESIGSIMVSEEYAISESKSLFYCSLLISISGIASVIAMLIFKKFMFGKFDARKLLISSLIPLTITSLLNIPMSSNTMPIHNCTHDYLEQIALQKYSIVHDLKPPLSIVLETQLPYESNSSAYNYDIVALASVNKSADHCLGCPVLEQPWCSYTPQLIPAQQIICYTIAIISNNIGISIVMGILVKVLGTSPLGIWMSLPSVSSCFSRIIGSLWMVAVYQQLGITFIYAFLGIEYILGSLILVLTYKRLSPMSFGDGGK